LSGFQQDMILIMHAAVLNLLLPQIAVTHHVPLDCITKCPCCVWYGLALCARVCVLCVVCCWACACVCSAQLAEVYWVEGLGPSKELWMAEADLAAGSAADIDGVDDAHHGPAAAAGAAGTHVRNTFADQVGAWEGRKQQ
jgi:hypothetical protein